MSELVAVDIGGTHVRFAIGTVDADGNVTLDEPETFETQNYGSFRDAWEVFRTRRGGNLPRSASIAVAGPVGGRTVRLTNSAWRLDRESLKRELGVERLALVNDFAAVAHAAARLPADRFVRLAGPDCAFAESGTIAVIGPGTGLGVAYFRRDEARRYRVQPTEGGHAGFAPLDPFEDALHARLRERHGRVSVERAVSGPAIGDICGTLAALAGRTIAEEPAATLWKRGIAGGDSLAADAVERFCRMLGSIAGDIALVQGAFAGVAIAGGLGYRLREVLGKSGFAERFVAKGRFAGLMAAIPVKLIVHPQPGLFGAAAAFEGEHS